MHQLSPYGNLCIIDEYGLQYLKEAGYLRSILLNELYFYPINRLKIVSSFVQDDKDKHCASIRLFDIF